jgi:DNA-directed RNA polymerase
MCKGINCNQTNTCYRYLAKANPYRQSYFSETPIKDDGTCNEYVKLLGAMEWNGQVREE